jgi:serine/threonine-protein kinase
VSDVVRDRLAAAIGAAYDVEQEIGRGGMGIVYRVRDLRLKRHAAVKVLPPDLAFRVDIRTRFLREAETAAQLSHPNIVQIYSVDERDGLVFFVMALVEGESLGARLVREPQPPIDEVRRILHDVAGALACAHAHGVIHRDIKPDNILLDASTGRPMVTDFGIARAAEADTRLTLTGVAMGSPAYMSPEQALGDREIDGRSDIYSLGLVGYQMLAGEPPFRAANSAAVMMKQINERPRALRQRRPDIPRALAAAVELALEKRPEDRWASADALRDALEAGVVAAPSLPAGRSAEERPVHQPAPAAAPPGIPVPPRPPLAPVPAPWQPGREDVRWRGSDWQRYGREQQRLMREQARLAKQAGRNGAGSPQPPGQPDVLVVERRIVRFRRSLISQGGVVAMLAGINALTSPHFPWFLFPTLGMGMGLVSQWGRLWSEGISWRQIWGYTPRSAPGAGHEDAAALARQEAQLAKLVPRDVLDGPHGQAVRRVVADREQIGGIIESLAKPDRALLPEVLPTVNALVERAASLAQMLHRLDADIAPGMLERIDARVAEVEREPESSADRERRLSLLLRQQSTLKDLAKRRERVAAQLDSAGLALQNLKFDLLKLRSSGVQAALGDVNSATVEARALSKDIGHVLEAAEEIRGL